jgi:hypothetical protein
MFEKYGGDPLKRSLKNQLISQFGYAMILNNTICTSSLTWRIILGPVHFKVVHIWSSILELELKLKKKRLLPFGKFTK